MAEASQLPVSGASSQLRSVYNTLFADPKNAGKIITYSYLRSELDLTGQGANGYKFPILVNDSPAANVNENRLNVGDSFQVVYMGLYLYKRATSATDRGSAVLQSFPNSTIFSAANEAANLMSLYNGQLNVTIDRTNIIPSMDCYQFYRASTAQTNVLTAASGTNNAYVASEFSTETGMVEVLPTFRMWGNKVNIVQLQPSGSPSLAGGGTTVNTLVFIARGFLIQGGANVGS